MEDVGDIVALWVHPFAKKLYFAFVIGVDTAEDIGKGGLAAAVGAGDDDKLIVFNGSGRCPRRISVFTPLSST